MIKVKNAELIITELKHKYSTLSEFRQYLSQHCTDFKLASKLLNAITRIECKIEHLNKEYHQRVSPVEKQLKEVEDKLRETQRVILNWRPKYFTELEKIFKDDLPLTFTLELTFKDNSEQVDTITMYEICDSLTLAQERTLKQKSHKVIYSKYPKPDDFAWVPKVYYGSPSQICIIYNWNKYFTKEQFIDILVAHQEKNPKVTKINLEQFISERKELATKLEQLKCTLTTLEKQLERLSTMIKVLKTTKNKLTKRLENTETFHIVKIVTNQYMNIFSEQDIRTIYELTHIYDWWTLEPIDLFKVVLYTEN